VEDDLLADEDFNRFILRADEPAVDGEGAGGVLAGGPAPAPADDDDYDPDNPF
jgi:hypothetical protein